jgi:hypothetical protein
MITIVAPSDLPANYQFQAVVGGHTIQVTVVSNAGYRKHVNINPCDIISKYG